MATTINHSFGDTFNVFDFVTGQRIGQITLQSNGWASYRATAGGHRIIETRTGTHPDAQAAIHELDVRFAIQQTTRTKKLTSGR